MKSLSTLLLIPALFLAPACSGDEAQAKVGDLADSAMEAGSGMLDSIKDLDVSDLGSMSADKVKEMFSGASGSIAETLGGISDVASAEKAKDMIAPMLDKLGSMKDMLGDNMPSMDSLKGAISGLTEKFSGDNSIMSVLQPILDKLQSLVG